MNKSGYEMAQIVFSDLGYRVSNETGKVIELQRSDGKTVYFLKLNKQPSLVFPPEVQAKVAEVAGQNNLKINERWYHNIHMKRFPLRMNTGKSPTRYGCKIEVRTADDIKTAVSAAFGSKD